MVTVLLLAITAVWGLTFSVVKDAVAAYGVVAFLAVRFVLGSACLAPAGLRRITRADLLPGIAVGVSLAAGYLLQTYGLRTTSATNCGLITGLFVVFAPLISRRLFGVRTSPLLWGAIALSVVGLALLTGTGIERPSWGDLLTLGAAVSYGFQIALLGHFARRHDTTALAALQVWTATLIFLLAWPLAEPLALPPAEVWPAILLCGLVATGLAFFVQTLAQKRLSPTRAAILLTTESVFALLFGYLLAGDRLAASQLVGAAVTIAAVALAEVGPTVWRARRGGPARLVAPEFADATLAVGAEAGE